jgi:hypothetical protein
MMLDATNRRRARPLARGTNGALVMVMATMVTTRPVDELRTTVTALKRIRASTRDPFGGLAIHPAARHNALRFLDILFMEYQLSVPIPTVGATIDGGISFEWISPRLGGYTIEVVFFQQHAEYAVLDPLCPSLFVEEGATTDLDFVARQVIKGYVVP